MCRLRPLTFLPPSNPQSPFFLSFLHFDCLQYRLKDSHFFQAEFLIFYLAVHSAFGINFCLSIEETESIPFSKEENRVVCQSIGTLFLKHTK